ncbi:MAG: hypothetical protein AAB971_00120 [Patescibacteria group bacterium]
MDDAKQQLTDKLKTANNILVTVSRDPSVDQLASCIGLTLLLNKQGKHAAAVFSGNIPSTLEFLQPEETLEKNTDSLRDFIIALDKSKADKLRYKVEDNVVRIFITPYKTSISQADLEFSEGDFNVDLVIALGVQRQEDLDEAITAHGRILHDATVTCINTSQEGGLGSINWNDPLASSLCELVTDLATAAGTGQLDTQIATALLTGIVAETNRFSNDKTSPQTMSASAALMAAGANQQLVASKLEEPDTGAFSDDSGIKLSTTDNDGTMEISHTDEPSNGESSEQPLATDAPKDDTAPAFELPTPSIDGLPSETPKSDTVGTDEESVSPPSESSHPPKMMTEPPSMGGTLTASSTDEVLEQTTDPLSMPNEEPPQLFDRKPGALSLQPPSESSTLPSEPSASSLTPDVSVAPTDQPPAGPSSTDPSTTSSYSTLSELEEAVQSPHLQTGNLDDARDEINKALNDNATTAPELPQAIEALNAQPLGGDLHPDADSSSTSVTSGLSSNPTPVNDQASTPSIDTGLAPNPIDPNAPPPVPPPIPFQFGNPPQSQ